MVGANSVCVYDVYHAQNWHLTHLFLLATFPKIGEGCLSLLQTKKKTTFLLLIYSQFRFLPQSVCKKFSLRFPWLLNAGNWWCRLFLLYAPPFFCFFFSLFSFPFLWCGSLYFRWACNLLRLMSENCLEMESCWGLSPID